LTGSAGIAFRSHFDLFRLERSADLAQWDSVATVVRTNAATNDLTFVDATDASSPQRFYRAASNHVLTPFLAPTGPHAVGTFSRMLTDPSRTNRFRVKTNSSFMVTFWYPAQAPTGNLAPYMDRLKAAVLLDACFGSVPTLLKNGLGKPFLTMMNPGGSGDNTTLFNKSAKDAYQLSIKDASHEAFTDNAWTVGPSTASRRRAQAMTACLLSFFNKHLKGMDDHLLDNPGAVHPDVIAFRKK
jgi:hypothetical protein